MGDRVSRCPHRRACPDAADPPVVERDKDRNNNEAIRAGDDIPSKLKEDLYNSAILLCVVSPRYLNSEYCRWSATGVPIAHDRESTCPVRNA